jgi:hypothetical protein
MKNDEHVYMQLKMFKQDHMKRMEVYYEHLMKSWPIVYELLINRF